VLSVEATEKAIADIIQPNRYELEKFVHDTFDVMMKVKIRKIACIYK
jgi:hypothetical protein